MAKRGRHVEAELRMLETAWGTFLEGLKRQAENGIVTGKFMSWIINMETEIRGCPLRRDIEDEYLDRLNEVNQDLISVNNLLNLSVARLKTLAKKLAAEGDGVRPRRKSRRR
jgi:hypothetical protein